MMGKLSIHWIVVKDDKSERVLLPQNSMDFVPSVGDELRASDKKFYKVRRIVWCLDEPKETGQQRVNIEIEKA